MYIYDIDIYMCVYIKSVPCALPFVENKST